MQTTLPDGRVLNNLYYGSGHLHQVNLAGEVVLDIERHRAHRMIGRTQGALVSQFQYDPVGRLLSQTAGPLAAGAGAGASPVIARRYEYDEVGNLVTIDDVRNGITRYGYDPIGRILSAVHPDLSERFAFDPAHNLIDTTVAPSGRIEGNRIRVYEDKRYDYDAHGNVVEKLVGRHTRMRFEWNALHQLVRSVVARSSSDTEQTVSYAYDPFGRRIAKRDAFGITRFVWDGNRLLCEQRESVSRTYVYGEEAFVPLARVDAVADGGGGAPRAEVRHLHTDHLGTPRELTDADGRVVWAARYRAWGNVLQVVKDEASSTVSVDEFAEELGSAQPVRFQGQYFDDETGLHYNRFRYYDPDVGRFVSIDPIGLAGGANLYQYAHNPISWADPLGWSPCKAGETSSSASTGIFVETGSGSIHYRALDPLGRPTGINASITRDMIKTGTPANPNISPPGWAGNGTKFNQARGHLLGNQLGGSGDIAENLVTLQQNWTNSPVMRGFEGHVRAAVENGQTVQYSAVPQYKGMNAIPRGVTLIGEGDAGFSLAVTILNPIGF